MNALFIVQRFRHEGYEGYLAGGCVRDMLLHKSPQDYDIATTARSEDVQRVFPDTVPVGAQFGVILVLVERAPFEVASFRYDGPYLDGRRPIHVRYGSLREDIQRRDFTINGMVYDPVDDRVIDLVDGQNDLARRSFARSATPGALRGRPPAHDSRRALRRQSELRYRSGDVCRDRKSWRRLSRQISWERIGDEITRILTEGGARRGFELLDESGLARDGVCRKSPP